jgi:hypothetical protein
LPRISADQHDHYENKCTASAVPFCSQIGICSRNILFYFPQPRLATIQSITQQGRLEGGAQMALDDAWSSRSSGFQQLRVPSSSDVARTPVIPNLGRRPDEEPAFCVIRQMTLTRPSWLVRFTWQASSSIKNGWRTSFSTRSPEGISGLLGFLTRPQTTHGS